MGSSGYSAHDIEAELYIGQLIFSTQVRFDYLFEDGKHLAGTGDANFHIYPAHVIFHALLGNADGRGDLFICFPRYKQPQD